MVCYCELKARCAVRCDGSVRLRNSYVAAIERVHNQLLACAIGHESEVHVDSLMQVESYERMSPLYASRCYRRTI